MNITKWLKKEFYLPQRNKAEKKVAYFKWSVQRYEEMVRQGKTLSRKDDGRLGYHTKMLASWELDLEKFNFKLKQIERS